MSVGSIKSSYHVESLGAGVQSTTIYLLGMDGRLDVTFDAAIFADTGDEPQAVYQHLKWLQELGGPPILVRSAGRLGDDIINGRNSTGQKFYASSIPAYTGGIVGVAVGKGHRQCTREYKIDVIERAVRRDVIGLLPRRRIPRGTMVHQYIGISTDEARRAASIKARFDQGDRVGVPHFPLLDLNWSRRDCEQYLQKRVPHRVGRSACVFCPLKSDREWLMLKTNDPEAWARAVDIDEALRAPGRRAAIAARLRLPLYLHRSARPLATAPLAGDGQGEFPYFATECEGACGV